MCILATRSHACCVQFNITAVLLVVVMSAIVIWGIKEGSHVNTVMVMGKLGVLVFFVVTGLTKFNVQNYTPLMPYGIDGVFKVGAHTDSCVDGVQDTLSVQMLTKNVVDDWVRHPPFNHTHKDSTVHTLTVLVHRARP